MIEQNTLTHVMGFPFPNKKLLTKELKELRNDPEFAYLQDVPAQILQQALWDERDAYDRFFTGQNKYPRYHERTGRQSFRIPQNVRIKIISKRWAELWVPLLGWIRFRYHQATVGRIKAATVIRDPDGAYYVSLRCEQRDHYPAQKPLTDESIVGVDLGCVIPVATSDGKFYTLEAWKPKERERLHRLERQRSRQVKGSKNQMKTKQKIAKMHARPKRRRKDFAEKVSNELTRDYAGIVMEDLIITNMTASASGTIEEPGTNVAQKSGLNKTLLDQGWGQVRTRVEEKAQRRGVLAVRERTPFSSQECSVCGYTDPANRPEQAVFICQSCGHRDHADVNAPESLRKRAMVKGRFGNDLVPTLILTAPVSSTASAVNGDGSGMSVLDLTGGALVTARQDGHVLSVPRLVEHESDQERQRGSAGRLLQEAGTRETTHEDPTDRLDQQDQPDVPHDCEQQDYHDALSPPEHTTGSTRLNIVHHPDNTPPKNVRNRESHPVRKSRDDTASAADPRSLAAPAMHFSQSLGEPAFVGRPGQALLF